MLANVPHLILDIYFETENVALHADSQIAALKFVHCQNLHVDTTLATITSKHICKYSVYSKTWYKSKIVSGNPLEMLDVKW